ncbi:MAG: glycosyltransferase family 39 protein [Chloroflexi bacterium]|nr:glycosyltransferase family 39 protein [Chloroflexota bacterium]
MAVASPSTSRNLKPSTGKTESALILIYWAVRLHNILALPLFLDEGFHIYLAQRAWLIKYLFEGTADGRLFNVWWYAVFWPFANGDFVARAGSLLLGTAGLAAVIAAGRALFAREVSWAAAAIYVVLPPAFFFERILLADSLTAPLVALVLWSSIRAVRSREGASRARFWIVLTAGILCAVLLTKISNLVFLVVPAVAAVLATRSPLRALRRAGAVYVLTALVLVPLVTFLVFRLHSSLGLGIARNKLTPAEMPGHVLANLQTLSTYAAAYLGQPLAWLIAPVSIVAALTSRRSGTMVALTVGIPFAVITTITRPIFYESRFFAPLMPGLALLLAAGGWGIGRAVAVRWGRRAAAVALAALGLLAGWHALAFIWQGWTTPSALPLPAGDRRQYFEEFSSGYGWPETRDFFRERSRTEAVAAYVLDQGGWQRLETYLYKDQSIIVRRTEPLNLAAALRDSLKARATYIVVDEPFLDAQLADLKKEIFVEQVIRFDKPGGRAAVVVYRVTGVAQ